MTSNKKTRYLFSQLDSFMQKRLKEKLRNTIDNNFIVIVGHAKLRANERAVNKRDLIKFLKRGEYRIIELNVKNGKGRCLIRTKAVNSYEIVASVCLNTGCVITCWMNSVHDNHDTLDMSLYSTDKCVFKF